MGKLSIIIPVFNEEKTLQEVIDRVLGLPADKEIIIVNDGSTDGTAEILKKINAPNVLIREHRVNSGKGTAIITGVQAASGDVIAVQDADLEYDPAELLRLAEPIFRNEADVIFGSRFLQANPRRYLRFYIGNMLMSAVISAIVMKRITDSYTCFKLFRREILHSFHLTSRGFEIEAELSVKVARGKYRFKEMPISYTPRSVTEGKKINWKDAVKGVVTAFRTRFRT